jgi:hypothetical protein
VKLAWLLFCLTLGLFAFQASGAFELAAGADCEQGCVDDDAHGRCAETCSDCACCSHPRPVTHARFAPDLKPELARFAPPCCRVDYASPPPGDILHVPRSILL